MTFCEIHGLVFNVCYCSHVSKARGNGTRVDVSLLSDDFGDDYFVCEDCRDLISDADGKIDSHAGVSIKVGCENCFSEWLYSTGQKSIEVMIDESKVKP